MIYYINKKNGTLNNTKHEMKVISTVLHRAKSHSNFFLFFSFFFIFFYASSLTWWGESCSSGEKQNGFSAIYIYRTFCTHYFVYHVVMCLCITCSYRRGLKNGCLFFISSFAIIIRYWGSRCAVILGGLFLGPFSFSLQGLFV